VHPSLGMSWARWARFSRPRKPEGHALPRQRPARAGHGREGGRSPGWDQDPSGPSPSGRARGPSRPRATSSHGGAGGRAVGARLEAPIGCCPTSQVRPTLARRRVRPAVRAATVGGRMPSRSAWTRLRGGTYDCPRPSSLGPRSQTAHGAGG